MKPVFQFTLIAFSILLCNLSFAQTLTEKLVAEEPGKLVSDARKNGDIVRGAILFHQGNINCAKCHRPASEEDRIGPDISRLEENTTDEQIIESILLPSKTIREGFETVVVLTVAGESFSGIVVEENKDQIVLRDGQDVDKLIKIAREDLEGIRPGKTSTMPDGLIDELKSRQQFLDLVRYVLDTKDRGPVGELAKTPTLRKELSPELDGLILIQKHNCIACHKSDVSRTLVDAKQPPRLQWSAKMLNPDYLANFIANPHATKPGTTMPDILGSMNATERKRSAEAIAVFLTSTFDNRYVHEAGNANNTQNGHELFHSVGCVACHSPRDQNGNEQPLADSEALGDLAEKYNTRGLVEFLKDPHSVRQSGRMPNMKLTHFEATDIANFLLQDSKPRVAQTPARELADTGKELFTSLNCASCHTDVVKNQQVSQFKPLRELNPGQGCLSVQKGDWPNFEFSDSQREQIKKALEKPAMKLTNEQQILLTLKTFNCTACHDRGDFGGITDLRNPHFQTTDLNLGEQGRIPPTLTGVGAKLKREWMRDVFVNRRSIRPYMKTRMPQYGEKNVGHLIDLFQNTDKLPESRFAKFEDPKEMRELGHQFAGNKGLNCVACHTFQYKTSDTMPAVDLTEMSERLKKDWFYQYMKDPQRFNLNTVMPSFWPGGEPIRKDLEGDPDFQVEAIWQYLLDGRQARMPSGVVRPRLEIVVDEEAQMLRRSYQGIGKRGIGVGYPGGVNIAFDAEQLRLGMIWKGKFVDPGGVWTGQGSGTARPMGNPINFGKGPQLDDLTNPWVPDDGRPPKHRFRGYTLDKLQQPTFIYDLESVKVSDFFTNGNEDENGEAFLRRAVTLTSDQARKSLGFRIASGAKITQSGDAFKIDERLTIRITSEHTAEIVGTDEAQSLLVPINLNANEEQILVFEYLWN